MSESFVERRDFAAGVVGERPGAATPEGALLDRPERARPATERVDHPRRRRRGALIAKVAAFVAAAALVVVLLQAFVVQPFTVPGDAMSPTVQAGDRILVLKWSLLEGAVHRGEVVVFRAPRSLRCTVVGGRGGDLVLRVVGLPGDVIRSSGSSILVDGRALHERSWYDPRFGEVGSTPIQATTVAPGQYYVLADNRSDACDSRSFGAISRSSIVGEGIAVVARNGHLYLKGL